MWSDNYCVRLVGAGRATHERRRVMGQPWGLSGPEFIGVYIAGLAAVICIPMVFRQVIRGAPSRPARDLDPYEVAYLAGGPSRVAQLVVTEQIGCGALRVDSSGRVTTAN